MPNQSPTPPTVAGARPKTSSSSLLSSNAASSSQQSISMASSGRPGRGSTPTLTGPKPTAKAADGERPTRPSSKDSLKAKLKKPELEGPRPSKSDEQLKVLKADFDSLRSHLTCKICDRLLYQPYIISCGHTYCYSCLCTWFVNNKSRKTCPDCRAVVTEQPAPAYLIREMTMVFITRAELLPAGETIEQHRKWQKEEADLVQQDKDSQDRQTGGLFKGCFRVSRPTLRAVRDQEDGVERCPLCAWELEDGECAQCGLLFDENGELGWGDSFTGFSDMDEMSERDMSGEDLDAEMDMDDVYDGFDNRGPWPGYTREEHDSYMMQRYLEHGIPPHAYAPRRRMTHSEAGSRGRSYSQSIVSDMYTEEMDTVEEEEDEDEVEDSSMNDFIAEDDEEEEEASSLSTSSTPGQTPQPSGSRRPVQSRARRVVESDASSTTSSVIEEEEEDEEDQGPIRRGQRNRAQTRLLNRANGSREPTRPPSSASTEASHEQDLDEDTQALLRADGWMLQHDGPDEEMEGEDDDDDSDGGRTTVGWEPTANSNDRVRMGGSLTPTADRPRPNGTIRPPSRTGNPRFMDASRGLRRRSSVLTTSTMSYEDGEADDDDSDRDQDGDITMAMNALRQRRSRAQLRNSVGLHPHNPNVNNRFANRGFSQGDAIDLDTDDNSDTSQNGNRGNAPRVRHPEYNPRISWMFADHQRALQEFQRGGPLLDLEARSTTPIARPRTANRGRPSPGPQFSPFMAPARLRTPSMDHPSANPVGMRGLVSPPRRSVATPTSPAATRSENALLINTAMATSNTTTSGPESAAAIRGQEGVASTSQQQANAVSQLQPTSVVDIIDRPLSRVSARPPSAAGRRNSAGFSPVYQGFPHSSVGLNVPGRMIQNQRLGGNPWAHLMQQSVRPRNSRPVLRDQSSTATLRPANSRINIREAAGQQQGIRPQVSRIDLRHQSSRRRLNPQASTRTLRASEHARPPPSPVSNAGTNSSSIGQTTYLSEAERNTRARELVNNRLRLIQQPNSNPVRTNPFTQGFRQAVNVNERVAPGATLGEPLHVRSNSNESNISNNSSATAQSGSSSPNLNRRRSNRNMSAPAAPPMATNQGNFIYANDYLRAQQRPIHNSNPVYESPLNPPAHNMNTMVTASGPLI
ncbi:hypothetical protein BU24DRAFT_422047 [Aaosphaeria arxii CBS 175.79]|uniref:RING-type domain-containing protein n=1 Tax=Aaosphaeria arxii CBS 175.79 TaxID=1450172 RepID=A0A6A5XS63_9PLEO|nr:uncharacterized protein BU24DRAFT_422047 [Aaosphaeria arxii CBS 175.79]KAF2015736.1 hypothetical protein BU24DRAFT_422047 [Aaosphaeria arxii CBS 175.79]